MLLPVNVYALSISERLAGQDQFQTARAISEEFNSGTIQDVIIASGNNFPDALSASVLAKKLNAPILLVNSKVQGSNEAFNYISQHLSKMGTVHIIGGMGIVSSDFDVHLKRLGYDPQHIDRIGGDDLYDTNLLIAHKLAVVKNTPVVIASGENFPDALSISSIASSKGWPILLVGKNFLAQGIKDYILQQQPSQIYIVGGTGVVSEAVKMQVQFLVPQTSITRLAGKDQFDTNALVIQTFVPNPKNIYLATGLNFADALAGSVLAAKMGDPIILVDPKSYTLPPKIVTYLSDKYDSKNTIKVISFGGSSVVPESQINSANSILNNTEGDATQIVIFQDIELERAVRDAINKPIGVLHKSDVVTLNQLKAFRRINDISGIDNLTHLTTLELTNYGIRDISSLESLTNLTTLRLSGNKISDINSLMGLTNLTILDLPGNQISDISNLKELTNLIALNLSHTEISDINSLKGLTNLTTLNLSHTEISDISSLKGLTNLTTLALFHTEISDISILKDLTNLTNLDLSQNEVSDIRSLKGLTSLTNLNLSDSQISNIKSLEELTNLANLYLSQNEISDISGLKGLINLTNLNLSGNQISDISGIKGLTNLTNLYLSGNQISDISGLKRLTNLTNLYLRFNQISDADKQALNTALPQCYIEY